MSGVEVVRLLKAERIDKFSRKWEGGFDADEKGVLLAGEGFQGVERSGQGIRTVDGRAVGTEKIFADRGGL